jgi:hypothetical protein
MLLPTIIELSEVTGRPKVRQDLPGPLRIGDRIRLAFSIERRKGGRTEVLSVQGEFRVSAIGFDTVSGVPKQCLQVDALGKAPSWQAIKKQTSVRKILALAISPKTEVL